LALSARVPGPTISLLGGISIPKVPGISRQLGEIAFDVHVAAAWLLMALIVLHVAAALKHQFVDHNRAAGRMPPFQDPVDEPVVIGQGGRHQTAS
jgi:cytochrome b561